MVGVNGIAHIQLTVRDPDADALPELEHRVEDYSAKVEGHLRRMGLPA